MEQIGAYGLHLFEAADRFSRLRVNDNTRQISAFMDDTRESMSNMGNRHVWRTTEDTVTYEIQLGGVGYVRITDELPVTASAASFAIELNYSASVTAEGGVAALGEPVTALSTTAADDTADALLRGRYIEREGEIYRVEDDGVVGRYGYTLSETSYYYYRIAARPVTVRELSVTSGSFVTSEEAGAYDGEGYQYTGTLGDRAMLRYGTYTGTGVCGEDAPNILSFDRKPVWVQIYSGGDVKMTLLRPSEEGKSSGSCTVVWSDTGVSWYADTASQQLNIEGKAYFFVALCE